MLAGARSASGPLSLLDPAPDEPSLMGSFALDFRAFPFGSSGVHPVQVPSARQ